MKDLLKEQSQERITESLPSSQHNKRVKKLHQGLDYIRQSHELATDSKPSLYSVTNQTPRKSIN